MTEAEWFGMSDPLAVRDWFLKNWQANLRTSSFWRVFTDRKLSLFATACCRRIERAWSDARVRLAVETAEKYCDARTNEERAIMKPVRIAVREDLEWARSDFGRLAKAVTGTGGWGAAWRCCWEVGYIRGGLTAAAEVERRDQMPLLREVVGNPCRPIRFSSRWRTQAAVLLARGMYASRDFGAMPILADALQDADCDSEEVLAHCRDPQQVHVRGCWVVDLVLGKS